MPDCPSELPASIDQCHALIQALLDSVAKKDRFIAGLQHQLEQHLRHRFGQRADRIDLDRPGLFSKDELLAAMAAVMAAPVEEEPADTETEKKAPKQKKPSTGHGRNEIPDHLPVEEARIDVADDDKECTECGAAKVVIREERAKQIEYRPASLFVIETVRPIYACPDGCEGQVVKADKPLSPIEKSLAGPGLLAQIAVSKYGDHLPLNRQEGILARHGVHIPRSTQCGWMRQTAELLLPLYLLHKSVIMSEKYICTDDTTVKLLVKGRRKAKTARIWAYGSMRLDLVIFDFTKDRSRDGPCAFLSGCHGFLQADAYPGYNTVFANEDLVEVGCWAHTRRKFCEARDSSPLDAAMAVAFIRRLYDVEDQAKELADKAMEADPSQDPFEVLAEHRLRLRQKHSRPILAEFLRWLRKTVPTNWPKSPLSRALTYMRNQRHALTRYTTDGHLEMDNNFIERAMRHSAVGRKNWMHVASERGGETMAILTSLIYSAKLQKLDLLAYLTDVLTRISAHPAKQLSELLPHNWTPPPPPEV